MSPKKKSAKKLTVQQWMRKEWMRKAEEKVYEEQHKLITEKHGKRFADEANYGWGVSATATHLGVATKVYIVGKVLSSDVDYPSFEITHEWREYNR